MKTLLTWLMLIYAASILLSIAIYLHMKYKNNYAYWWLRNSLTFPYDYIRFRYAVKGLLLSELKGRVNKLCYCTQTWFVRIMIKVVLDEISKRR